jgi:hypothetical protein
MITETAPSPLFLDGISAPKGTCFEMLITLLVLYLTCSVIIKYIIIGINKKV